MLECGAFGLGGGMPKRGKHPERALTALKIRSLKEPGRYADGNGLYLVVDPSGAKRWMLRTVVQGRRRDIGLGGTSLVSLAEAREKALSYRKRAREGACGGKTGERRQLTAFYNGRQRAVAAGELWGDRAQRRAAPHEAKSGPRAKFRLSAACSGSPGRSSCSLAHDDFHTRSTLALISIIEACGDGRRFAIKECAV